MQELEVSEFGRVRPLFEGLDCMHAAVFTVLEGRQAGRVWVDRREAPASVLLRSDACYLGGELSEPFLDELLAYLQAEVIPHTEHILVFSFADAWRDALDALLAPYEPRRMVRTVYRSDPDAFRDRHAGWQARVPEGYTVARLDASTAAQVGGIPELWGSIDHFLAEGFGFCVTPEGGAREGANVSSAQTVFVGDRHAETGIGTEEGYRRQGLATLAASAYLEHCLEAGITPEWGCMYNPVSGSLAGKMGFVKPREIEVTYVHVPQEMRQHS
jgi:RimJ/RimL family protein N-acetyltransferase